MGTDILYSGTVSAALEGSIAGYPSIAVSCVDFNNPMFDTAGQIVVDLLKKIDIKKMPEFTTLNVNVPNVPLSEIKGIKVTRQSTRRYEDYFEERKDPYGNSYYWLLGKVVEDDDMENSDYHYVNKNYVSITPLSVFLTNKEYLDKLIRVIEE
jgi:5'-nucleotidase